MESWSPSSLTVEPLAPLDSILPSVSSKVTIRAGGLCSMDGKICGSPCEGGEDDDEIPGLSNDTTKNQAQEETYTMLSPSESTNYCGFGLAKRAKVEQSGTASKAQMSQNQVRKLGEKITALQQLVSPFGKTDTASVLMEAIGYIKFLQDQVHVLSSPYMVVNGGRKCCESGKDLRSRGLCLVPVSCTLNVANSNGADYWISGISRCSR